MAERVAVQQDPVLNHGCVRCHLYRLRKRSSRERSLWNDSLYGITEPNSQSHLLHHDLSSPVPESFHPSTPASITLDDASFCATVGNAEEIPKDLTRQPTTTAPLSSQCLLIPIAIGGLPVKRRTWHTTVGGQQAAIVVHRKRPNSQQCGGFRPHMSSMLITGPTPSSRLLFEG